MNERLTTASQYGQVVRLNNFHASPCGTRADYFGQWMTCCHHLKISNDELLNNLFILS